MSRSPEQHAAEIAGRVPQRPTAAMGLVEAAEFGARVARDVTAAHPSPRFDNSQMDGYALSDTHVEAPGEYRVGPTIAAGLDPDELYPDGLGEEVAPIMTGAKTPRGTAAIVPVEHCSPEEFVDPGGVVQVPEVLRGQFIRAEGSDIPAGSVIVPEGTIVTAPVVATLAGQSIGEVEVTRPGRMVVVTGGAEISQPAEGQDDASAVIPDSNSPMLAAMAHRYGMRVVGHVNTDDDPDQLRQDLERAVEDYAPDVVVTSGGISAGKFEVVRQVLEPAGWFGHVDQQPGGPQGLSEVAGTPVICLPGNPVSTLVSFRLYVAPFFGTVPEEFQARLAEETTGLEGREQFLRGRVEYADGEVIARPVGGAGSHLISQAVPATCLIRIPQSTTLAAGELVTVYPL